MDRTMTTDKRTNLQINVQKVPTEAQIEAAALAIHKAFPHSGGGSMVGDEDAELAARVALEAAFAVAPALDTKPTQGKSLRQVILELKSNDMPKNNIYEKGSEMWEIYERLWDDPWSVDQ